MMRRVLNSLLRDTCRDGTLERLSNIPEMQKYKREVDTFATYLVSDFSEALVFLDTVGLFQFPYLVPLLSSALTVISLKCHWI